MTSDTVLTPPLYSEELGISLRTRILIFVAPILVFCICVLIQTTTTHGLQFRITEKLGTYSLLVFVFLLLFGLTNLFYSGKIEVFPSFIRLTTKSFYLQKKDVYDYPKSTILDSGIGKIREGRRTIGAITDHTLVGVDTDSPIVELRPWVKFGPGTMSGDGVVLSIQNEKRPILVLSRNPEELLKMIKSKG